jgi:hypothetical protein
MVDLMGVPLNEKTAVVNGYFYFTEQGMKIKKDCGVTKEPQQMLVFSDCIGLDDWAGVR